MNDGCTSRAPVLGVVMLAMAMMARTLAAAELPSEPRAPHDRPLTLQVRLTVASDLPATARVGLTEEAETIWARAGVRVRWLSPGDVPTPADPVLRVLVGQLFDGAHEGHAWPVGKLLPDQVGDRIAIASIPAAQRVIAAAGHDIAPVELDAHRLGLVLGRAVAHEIGHYLLGSASHARRGLMRAQIDARDFADLRGGGFFLDVAAARWIAQQLTQSGSPGHLPARFVY